MADAERIEQPEGWHWPRTSPEAHYFAPRGGHSASLCGAWIRSSWSLLSDDQPMNYACRACVRELALRSTTTNAEKEPPRCSKP